MPSKLKANTLKLAPHFDWRRNISGTL